MAVNVEIQKNGGESTGSVLRRFTRRVQGAGFLPRVRSLRYHDRVLSDYLRKKQTLKKLGRRAEHERLLKLGLVEEKKKRGRR